jgi:hypothetical protein
VIRLNYLRDNVEYLKKVADINDEEIAQKLLPQEVEVSELTYNECAGYLLHSSKLKQIAYLQADEGQAGAQTISRLPCYAIANSSLKSVTTLMETNYFSESFIKLTSLVREAERTG